MSAIQLNFTLRTSATCKTVHLLGSWDHYTGQLPLSKDPNKSGGWKGTFRFQDTTLRQGQRYWYYYILDGYHVSHDPARDFVTEPTTRRKLNTLDVPPAKRPPAAASSGGSTRSSKGGHSRRPSNIAVPTGRALSPSAIQSPRPTKPHETRSIRAEHFPPATVERLTAKLASTRLRAADTSSEEDSSSEDSDSDISPVPSLGSSSGSSARSSNSSTPSSLSSTSSCCTCERYGITRAGARVKLDCGGARCSPSLRTSSNEGSECSEQSEEERRERQARYRTPPERTIRRQGVVVRERERERDRDRKRRTV